MRWMFPGLVLLTGIGGVTAFYQTAGTPDHVLGLYDLRSIGFIASGLLAFLGLLLLLLSAINGPRRRHAASAGPDSERAVHFEFADTDLQGPGDAAGEFQQGVSQEDAQPYELAGDEGEVHVQDTGEHHAGPAPVPEQAAPVEVTTEAIPRADIEAFGDRLLEESHEDPEGPGLTEAIAAFKRALNHVPDDLTDERARLLVKIGSASLLHARRSGSPVSARSAMQAFRSSAEPLPADAAPRRIAQAWGGLGEAGILMAQLQAGEAECLDDARAAFARALEPLTAEGQPRLYALYRQQHANALRLLGQAKADAGRLKLAINDYRDFLETFTLETVPVIWMTAKEQLALALETLAEFDETPEHLYRDANTVLSDLAERVSLSNQRSFAVRIDRHHERILAKLKALSGE